MTEKEIKTRWWPGSGTLLYTRSTRNKLSEIERAKGSNTKGDIAGD